jgi:hypothetical protein
MDKYAAEKIASEYYNMGVQLAIQNVGLQKTAAPSGKQIAAMLSGVSVSPLVLEETSRALGHDLGRSLGGTTGWLQSNALRNTLGLTSDFTKRPLDLLAKIPEALKYDVSRLAEGKGLRHSYDVVDSAF